MSLEKLLSEYETFKKRFAELSKDLRKNFPPLFVDLFAKHPWVESFSWRQCEPWRDGDETEFEVLADAEQISINDQNIWDDGVHGDTRKEAVYVEFASALANIPIEVMKAMFGESNEIEVKKSGEMNVSEYEDG